MSDQEEVQEQMKVNMSALKEQMTSIMDAMLGMKQLLESNAVTAAAVSSAAEADPTLPTAAPHPIPNMVGREKSMPRHVSNPHLQYNQGAYPYGLPPNYTPPVIRDDAGHIPSLILEGEPPRHPDMVHEDHREHAQGDIDSYSPFPTEGPVPNALPQPNITGEPRSHPTQPIFMSVGGPPLAAEGKGKLDLIEERLRAIEGFGDYPFADMTDLCLVLNIVIPPKFKVPDFDRYKGTTCPKNHLKMYCRKMGAYSRDKKLLMHFFQDSLAGATVIWYTNLEAFHIRTWKDLIMAFLRQYQYNSDMAPDRTQLQNMSKREHESFKEYAQRWRDLAAQVAPPMVEREMVTMMVDTLPIFYYEKLVGYMPSSFADLVFARERIEVGFEEREVRLHLLHRYQRRRVEATGEKRKEGDAHAVTSTPAWAKPPQISHGTHQYVQHHLSFSAHAGDSSNSVPVQPSAPMPIQRGTPKLRLQPRLAQPAMPTLASAPTRQGTFPQSQLKNSPRSR
ncbi:uncharacterized protein [Glycine max]|uniref:uncharacterized protein n=1 Tax=Glycine max TaxID=3847 RepID=UPI0003DEB8B8|nr:uncharacterized protein LOC102664171 [Glycine max]|eukprot:XP_006582608.1 uncharacterized protein LOC102664171 [Glycine max]